MLNPFLIRDLHASSPQGPEDEAPSPMGRLPGELPARHDIANDAEVQSGGELRTRPHGIVRLTGSQYDDIASNHPRARLTYIDDDDGELITVSLLAQVVYMFRLTVCPRSGHLLSFHNA